MYNFQGKRALVTGAGKGSKQHESSAVKTDFYTCVIFHGQGIGRDLAKVLVECGAETYALSRTLSDLESLKLECPSIKVVHCDLRNYEELQQKVKSCGPIDLLVNNAAIAILEPFVEISQEVYQKTMDVNLQAPLFVSQIVAKGMIERKSGGSIVNVSSQASMRAINLHTVYCAAKAALDQLTKNMSLELGPHKIRVNAVNPTIVNTDMGKVCWSDPVKANGMKRITPLGRFAEVKEVTSVILFLLSDQSEMITGSSIPIDGGVLGSLIPS